MPPIFGDMPPRITLPFNGTKLRAMRERRGLEQQQLSALVGIAPENLSRYETGSRRPSVAMFARFVRALECDPDDLLDDSAVGAA